jgi:hypothetical protein
MVYTKKHCDVWALSVETAIETKCLPFREITLGIIVGALEIPLSSTLNLR